MKDRIQAVCAEHLDGNGKFQWPTDQEARDKLASRLLGACIVAAMDDWIEKSLAGLGTDFSAAQQVKVRRLLFETVHGVVLSILVKLDQFPCANLDLVLTDSEHEEKLASIFDGDIIDLPDRLLAWTKEFSEHADEYGK